MANKISLDAVYELVHKMPQVPVDVHNALTLIIENIQTLEAFSPITVYYGESFIEALMNIFPSCGAHFHVNPNPVVDMVVLDEDNNEIHREPGTSTRRMN